MQKAVIVAVVVLVCLPALLYAKGARSNSRRTNAREGQDEASARPKDCGQWTEGQCTLKKSNATCGKGNMVKTRTGDNCPVKEMTVKCKIDCPDAPPKASGGRNRNNRKTACKYNKGQWSECDASTNTKTRTLTLKTSRRNASPAPTECEPTKVLTKRCTSVKAVRKPHRGSAQ